VPHSTIAFPFEGKVFEWLDGLCTRLRPGPPQTYLILLDDDGGVQSLSFERPAEHWAAEKDRLRTQDRPFVFFDPFDYPEYAWVEWHRVSRATMERLLGAPFEQQDFVSARDGTTREYPESWGVMY
jgi:hypothetical protein